MYTTKTNNNLSAYTVSIICIIILSMIINMQAVYSNLNIISNSTSIIHHTQVPTVKTKSINIEDKNITLPTIDSPMVTSHELVVQTIEEKAEERRQQLLEQKMLEEQQRQEELARLASTIESSRDVEYYEISVYTDLSVMSTVTADEMNLIIEYWDSLSGTPFAGEGQIFIDAAKESGLDPVYILAHAALESAWGTSYLATTHHNYFGIGAYDSNPNYAANYGNDEMAQGIIEGAKWIADHYYDNGQTSLYTMRYNGGSHEYCTSETWMYNIANIMATSYSLIA